MRCYYVLVHGLLRWHSRTPVGDEIGANRPAGFYCHRYLLAADEDDAVARAFRRVSDNLEREFGWVSSGAASLNLEAEEVSAAPILNVLKPDNKGHTYYAYE